MKKLEELLNLPENRELVETSIEPFRPREVTMPDYSLDGTTQLDKIEMALPLVKGLGDQSDDELDELADKAIKSYEDLMDLAMNVEPRYCARLMEIASAMLKNAIDAKNIKVNSKLKMVDLQLRKKKVDYDTITRNDKEIEGQGFVVTDRNSLLEKMRNIKNSPGENI